MYYILMGDIIKSREQKAEYLWNCFGEIINNANLEYHDFMLSPLEIKSGDEFQVILKDMESSLNILLYLNTYFRYKDIKCRYTIGYGEIETPINHISETNMLGKALTETYELLNDKINTNRYRFYIQHSTRDQILLNTIGELLTEVEERITKVQYNYLYYKIVLKYDIEQISNILNVSTRNIYTLEERSNYKLIQNTFKSIQKIFQ